MVTRVEDVTLKLREMIVTRKLAAGSRVPERDLAELLGVSRTPVRVALGILQAEGLVSGEPNCGFIVRPFGVKEVLSAYDVRAALEALAVRSAFERGVGQKVLQVLDQCVAEGQALVDGGVMGDEEMRRWANSNSLFHSTLVEAADLPALVDVHAFVSRMPLAAPVAIMFTDYKRDVAQANMADAHREHVDILTAIRRGEGSRAESLMREHVLRSRDNLGFMLREQMDLEDEEALAAQRSRPRVRRRAV
jgi:GntR family transcriptional regulator of vanillate catabolism